MRLASGPVLRELLAREWRERYQGSVLGVAWLGLLPLAQLAVLAFVFGTLLPAATAEALGWNPLVAPLEAIRHGLSGEGALPWAALGVSALVAVVLLGLSLGLQRRAGRHIEDFL